MDNEDQVNYDGMYANTSINSMRTYYSFVYDGKRWPNGLTPKEALEVSRLTDTAYLAIGDFCLIIPKEML